MPYWPVRYPDHRNSSHGSRIHRGLLWFKCTWSKQLDSQHSMLTHFYYPTNALHYTNLEVKIDVVQKFKRQKIKNHSDMFRILCDRSSWSTELCLTEITRRDSQIFGHVLGRCLAAWFWICSHSRKILCEFKCTCSYQQSRWHHVALKQAQVPISRSITRTVIFSSGILEKKWWWMYFNFSNLLEEKRIVTYQN